MDQEPEVDNGYVELVNAKEDENGSLAESPVRTNLWAWKHPHKAEGTVTYTRQEGGVVFDDVDFGYDENKIVLHNISLYAKPGQKIAFVGATGAGKTTITNLINRFYDIADGKIRYDGININKIKKPDLRRSLGMVLQDTHLFTGTVMDNIPFTVSWMLRMKSVSRLQSWPMRTDLSAVCRMDITPCLPVTARI